MIESATIFLIGFSIICFCIMVIFTFISIIFWLVDSICAIWYTLFTTSRFEDAWQFCHDR